ncbi:hypothetical protein QCD85_19020 [Paenibacillus sp. PsM32]|uniref:hypothetical protein n=1 Tax=Paenibacillus sp. PsM32 TaxID=3030536 RepID=UPI00263B16F7|nr:hypothetical protein [Paenibacillus sp. PsM32]MDN4620214.1 hypothetical protein [Paenibacillus sp. PsM32]
MDNRIALCTELENEISKQGYSLSRFSQISGINRGILSATLNGNPPKPMSINQLDTMTTALGKPEGWLYERFAEQCFDEQGKTNWRRVRALLLRCIELNRNVLIERILCLLLEDISYLNQVFELAEELIADNPSESVMQLYECVVSNERNYQAERLAISHYRIFRYAIKRDIKQNFIAAVTFQPFCERLPDDLKLEGWTQLAIIYYTVQEWKMMRQCADLLIELTKNLYNSKRYIHIKAERPFIKYYGQGYLLKATFYEKTEEYDTAIMYTSIYSDLSWFICNDPQSKIEIENFKMFAEGNMYCFELYKGNLEVIEDYVLYLQHHKGEIISGILTILTVANKFDMNIDHILKTFHSYITSNPYVNSYQNKYVMDNQYTNVCYQLALYQSKHQKEPLELHKTIEHFKNSLQKCNMSLNLDYTSLLQNVIRSMP